MTQIKIIGANCSNGMKLKKMTERALEEVEKEVTLECMDHSKQYGISNIPALIIDEEIVSEGKVLTVREIKKLIA
ncbi:MAG: thioredoxin family protein [Bacilli bacterium]|nr:thioredoxin family protein [Bacilli bacterium]